MTRPLSLFVRPVILHSVAKAFERLAKAERVQTADHVGVGGGPLKPRKLTAQSQVALNIDVVFPLGERRAGIKQFFVVMPRRNDSPDSGLLLGSVNCCLNEKPFPRAQRQPILLLTVREHQMPETQAACPQCLGCRRI